jgi:ATP-binding cassette subfamily B protein
VLISMPATILVNNYLPALILADVLSRISSGDFIKGDLIGSFGWQLALYAVLLLGGIGFWRIVDHFAWNLEANVQKDVAEEVFENFMDKSADFHANHFSGSLVSATNKLLSSYVRMADTTMFQGLPLFFGIIIASLILIPKAPLFTVFLLVFSALYLTIAIWVSKSVREVGARHAAAESRQTGFLADAISNVMVVKSFARRLYERKRFQSATTNTRDHLFALARDHRKKMNWLGVSNRVISALALVVAVIVVMFWDADIGTVFLIFSYTSVIVDQLFRFSNDGLRNYNRSIGDTGEIIRILSEPPSVVDPAKPEKVRIKAGDIEFNDVIFQHDGSDDAIFNRLDLRIRNGEKIGLVGHSGSGKTTFTRLLQRFSDIDSGEILIDGQNIAHITQEDLHRRIAYVPQEPLLFHRTIEENISYGKPEATKAEIRLAAKRSHADEFISALPSGYDTLVGERGVKLSGGQRQRVAIARAMLKDAPILVLDEATSALDSESEVLIQDALWKLMEGRTAIVIAHRLSTIQRMDRIIVLDNGNIVEQGSHKQLIAAGGTYAKLWSHQSGGFMEE